MRANISQNCTNFNSVQEIEEFCACTVSYTGLVNLNMRLNFRSAVGVAMQPYLDQIYLKLHKFQFCIKYWEIFGVNSRVLGVREFKYRPTIGIFKRSKWVATATKLQEKSANVTPSSTHRRNLQVIQGIQIPALIYLRTLNSNFAFICCQLQHTSLKMQLILLHPGDLACIQVFFSGAFPHADHCRSLHNTNIIGLVHNWQQCQKHKNLGHGKIGWFL